MTEAQIKHMVDRFLAWKLPTAFNPDGGISFERIAGANGPHPFVREPSGTNLFGADQAAAMVRHMLEGLPETKVAAAAPEMFEAGSKYFGLLDDLRAQDEVSPIHESMLANAEKEFRAALLKATQETVGTGGDNG